jgi:two-component system, cell cycle sensor histidine kinase and response regulator CckA
VLDQLPREAPARDDLREILHAGESAAVLTRQLLAFSRKQVLEPRVLDLNTVVVRLDKMLRRLIGEHIRLALELAPELGRVKADPGQLEQVVMNLVVNARDAMPHGGTVTVATADVDFEAASALRGLEAKPGPHVLLRVHDTGHGMDGATQRRVFEPFFTTKALGKGTGLGLSTVYGIVKQSGGSIRVQSEPGKGATFEVYLPRVDDALQPAPAAPTAVRPLAGNETLLVVEDDAAVRRVTERLVRAAGYRVLTAASPAEALRLEAEHPGPLHLLLTDMVMPGMSGRELAVRLRRSRPELRVLFMSGYTDGGLDGLEPLALDAALVAKPFTATELMRKVREALDAQPAGSDGAR